MRICSRCAEAFPDDAAYCPLDGTTLAKSTDPYLGRTIAGRFRLIQRIGSGGMSSVYLARHVMIDRMSAIKILREDLGLNPNHRERFLREARAVNRINHPNIVAITDFGEMDGLVFLVMEHVAGEELLSVLRRGAMPWERAARIAAQIASALARAHEMGIVHRDLKPENVLIGETKDGFEIVKLTDFGIAKILDAPALTFSEQIFGTPGYIAPEYLEGLPPDGRSDLYALGVMLYEMLTGRLPYEAKGQAELLLKPLTSSPTPPTKYVPDLPPDLEMLVLRLLARHPVDRFPDGYTVVHALEEVYRRGTKEKTTMPPPSMRGPGTDRERWSTIVDAPQEPRHHTAEFGRIPTANIPARWREAFEEVARTLALAKKKGGSAAERAAKAEPLVEHARELLQRVERNAERVAKEQALVDSIEERGRETRARLGFAIDELGRDRARVRAHADEVNLVRRESARPPLRFDPRAAEVQVWQDAALSVEEEAMLKGERDLSFQIDTLTTRLETETEIIARELTEPAARLEGGLSAIRSITTELVRVLDDAISILSPGRRR
ncbi:MAG: protein kinase [Myxococcales bacterium]|nr:protein kinase [Myxococcales bacterium]